MHTIFTDYEEYRKTMRQIARQLHGYFTSVPQEDIMDFVSFGLTKAFVREVEFPVAYARQIATLKCIDFTRKKKTEAKYLRVLVDHVEEGFENCHRNLLLNNIAQFVMNSEDADSFLAAEKYADLLCFHKAIEGLHIFSDDELAEKYNIQPAGIRQRRRRLLNQVLTVFSHCLSETI